MSHPLSLVTGGGGGGILHQDCQCDVGVGESPRDPCYPCHALTGSSLLCPRGNKVSYLGHKLFKLFSEDLQHNKQILIKQVDLTSVLSSRAFFQKFAEGKKRKILSML